MKKLEYFSNKRCRRGIQAQDLSVLALVTALLCGCAIPKPLKGGRALTTPKPSGLEQTLVPPDNPAQPSRQEQETIKVRTYTIPAGSRIDALADSLPAENSDNGVASSKPGAHTPSAAVSSSRFAGYLSAPMPVTEREVIRAHTELGAAQKDTARELGTKLASMRSLTWVGLVLFVFGLTSLFWPPLRCLIGSITTSIAITLGGVALMILPDLIVGHELLILGGVATAVGAWFIAHRHGALRSDLRVCGGVKGLRKKAFSVKQC